jgi:hypothetical protein
VTGLAHHSRSPCVSSGLLTLPSRHSSTTPAPHHAITVYIVTASHCLHALADARALPSLLALPTAEDTREAAVGRVLRTRAVISTFLQAAAAAKAQRDELLAAVTAGGPLPDGVSASIKADLEGAASAREAERTRCESLERQNTELETDLAREATLAMTAADERDLLAFQGEKYRNHISSLSVRLEDALAAALVAATPPVSSAGMGSAGSPALGVGRAASGGARGEGEGGGPMWVDPELKAKLDAAETEIRALESQVVEARQREERAVIEAAQQVRPLTRLLAVHPSWAMG